MITSRPPYTACVKFEIILSRHNYLVNTLTNFEDFLKYMTFQTKKIAVARPGVTVDLSQLRICPWKISLTPTLY